MPGSEMETVTMEAFQKALQSETYNSIIQGAIQTSVNREMCSILQRLEMNESKIMDLEVSLKIKKAEVVQLSKHVEEQANIIKALKNVANDQEQYSRRNCLRIFGVSEKKGENTDEIVCELATKKLGVSLKIGDIDRSHRVGPRKPEQPNEPEQLNGPVGPQREATTLSGKETKTRHRPIIVKFASYRARRAVISQRRKLKQLKMGIEEDLTRTNQEILLKTRNHNKFVAAWSSDGRIIALMKATGGNTIKKLIKSLDDLKYL